MSESMHVLHELIKTVEEIGGLFKQGMSELIPDEFSANADLQMFSADLYNSEHIFKQAFTSLSLEEQAQICRTLKQCSELQLKNKTN